MLERVEAESYRAHDVDLNRYFMGHPENYLSKEEELAIGRLPFNHEDRWKLVLHNHKFLIQWCLRYYNRNQLVVDLCRLLSVAQDTMIHVALQKYQDKGSRFVNYAAWFMKRDCDKEVHQQLCVVKLPPLRKENLGVLREDTSYELPISSMRDLMEQIDDTTDTSCAVYTPSGGVQVLVPYTEEQDTDARLQQNQLEHDCKAEIKRKIKNPLYHEILTLAWGLNGEPPWNNTDIAKKFGYTREGIRRILERCSTKLRTSPLLKEHFACLA
jgi:RNA polymerase primary sigma factor